MRTWIFQGNQKVFDINKYIMSNEIVTWSLKIKKFQEEISIGDRVFIWRTEGGKENPGGIIALTEVISKPYYSEEEKVIVVDLKVKEKRITMAEKMLTRANLKMSVKTKFLNIIRNAQGTNFSCSYEQEIELINYWNDPQVLIEDIKLNIVDQYLNIYKEKVEDHLHKNKFVAENYNFFCEFKKLENLEEMQWEDIQELGKHINGFSTNALARKRALGNPNAPIERYRKSFIYLIYGNDSMEERINKFLYDEEYKLFGIKDSAVSEIMGSIFPEEVCFYNKVDKDAVEIVLGLSYEKERGEKFSKKLIKFNKLLKEHNLLERYENIVGWRTNLPHNIELDQFFYFLVENYLKYFKVTDESDEEEINVDTLVNESEDSGYLTENNNLEFTMDDFLKEIFLPINEVNEILELFEYKKNIILQGPPGVGKTFMAKRLAYLHSGKKDNSKIEMIQFHQSYSYEDFIRGFKPDVDGESFIVFVKELEKMKKIIIILL